VGRCQHIWTHFVFHVVHEDQAGEAQHDDQADQEQPEVQRGEEQQLLQHHEAPLHDLQLDEQLREVVDEQLILVRQLQLVRMV